MQAREDPDTYPPGHYEPFPYGRITARETQLGSFCLTMRAVAGP